MSHQPSRTSDITSEWPEERKKKSSKSKSKSVTPSNSNTTPTSSAPASISALDPVSVDVDDVDEVPEWDASTCLFCPMKFEDFDSAFGHMADTHILSIPSEDKLVVNVETLLAYCYVVIHAYLECPMCGTQRQTLKPLQAHMRDKGHCGFSVEEEESDFRVFYDFEEGDNGEETESGETGEDGEDGFEEKRREMTAQGLEKLVEVGDGQVRLASGRVVASKAYRAPRPAKETKASEVEVLHNSPNLPSSSEPATSTTSSTTSAPQTTSLTRADKRNLSASKALTQLRAADQMQLAHLPAAQQRAVLSTQKKQLAKNRRAQQWMEGRVKGKGNKFLQANYRADGPGRANG